MADNRTSFDLRHERLKVIDTQLPDTLPKMTTSTASKSETTQTDDVDAWIKSVRALKEKRLAEDEARNKQLEEDILRERQARQERRATRSRSNSPVKTFSSPNLGYERSKEGYTRASQGASHGHKPALSDKSFDMSQQVAVSKPVDMKAQSPIAIMRVENTIDLLGKRQNSKQFHSRSTIAVPRPASMLHDQDNAFLGDIGNGSTTSDSLDRSPVLLKPKGSLAGRFGNPNLATIIHNAHIPRKAQKEPKNCSTNTLSQFEASTPVESQKLAHMTKHRARRTRLTRPTTTLDAKCLVISRADDEHPSEQPRQVSHDFRTVSSPRGSLSIRSSIQDTSVHTVREKLTNVKQGVELLSPSARLKLQPRHTLLDNSLQRSTPEVLSKNEKHDSRENETRMAPLITANPKALASASSPFSSVHRANHAASKSVTNMPNIADLIKSRADCLQAVAPVANTSVESGVRLPLRVWSMRKLNDDVTVVTNDINILRNDEMKLVVVNGEQNNAFLWIGTSANPACEPALLKLQHNLHLIKVYMGQEPAEFISLFQHNTIVTKVSELAGTELMCVRETQSGYAIDQLPGTASSLCSGFVFIIINAQKTWLWLGKGSHPGEQQAANLYMKSRAPVVHCVTVYEGREEPSLWDSLGGHGSYASSSYWRLRRDVTTYRTTLYSVRDQEVVRRDLFSRHYLAEKGVHIIDTFFELYIHLGPDSRKVDIIVGIQWCKELCRSLSSVRPFVPIVLLLCPGSSLPRDLNAVFRVPSNDRQKSLRVLEASTAEHMLNRQCFSYAELQTGTIIGVDLAKLDLSISAPDFAAAMGVERQNFERLSAAEQENLRVSARNKLLSSIASRQN